jgi:predicted phage-related endonuclease
MSAITETFQAQNVATVPQSVVFDSRLPWLEGRNKYIGSSEAAAILGFGYAGESPTTVWASKVHGTKKVFSKATLGDLEEGRNNEAFVVESFAKRNPEWKVTPGHPFELQICKEHPYLACTIDASATRLDEKIVIEAKWIMHQAHEWADGKCPLKYQIQIMHQMICLGINRGVVIARVCGEFHERWIERDEALVEQMLLTYQRFWQCVIDRTPPEDDSPIAFESLQVERDMGFGKQLGKEASDKVREVLKLQDEETKLARKLAIAKSDVSVLKLGVEWVVLDDQQVVRLKKSSMEKKAGLPRGVKFK